MATQSSILAWGINPTDRAAWWATVHGVTEQTWPSTAQHSNLAKKSLLSSSFDVEAGWVTCFDYWAVIQCACIFGLALLHLSPSLPWDLSSRRCCPFSLGPRINTHKSSLEPNLQNSQLQLDLQMEAEAPRWAQFRYTDCLPTQPHLIYSCIRDSTWSFFLSHCF